VRSSVEHRFSPGAIVALVGLCVFFVDGIAADEETLDEEQARDGYESNCGMCHGYDGIPMLAGAPNFSKGERLEKSDAELLKTIGEGKGAMPPWTGTLSEGEQEAILAYVRSLAQQQ
jgi:mono/diheme cytochrome c family protein